jgi:peptidoglycan/LPS O-acetylase OafA/YrhL
MRYRSEIDGLRAIAVIPVILFHAGFAMFGGGFVGVDVFFVISGFLITSIIAAELEADKFSIVQFYERRARRILPALFFVLLVCLPFAWLWLFPEDMKSFARSLMAVPVFASNIYFQRNSGYFDGAAELKPLLHTWSLAVEEQYYLFFPILLMVAWRLGKRVVVLTLVVLAAASLGLAQWGAITKSAAAFFLLPTRSWELLVGALVALHLLNSASGRVSKWWNEGGGALGALLLLYAIVAFDKETPFPSLYTVIPTAGTALMILCASPQTVIGRLLGNKLLVRLGLVSYSAYLWHQPLFAFARLRSFDHPSQALMGGLAVAAVALAYLTWRFVETPFRNRQAFGRKEVFVFGGVASVFFAGIGLVGHLSGGFLNRYSVDTLKRIQPAGIAVDNFCKFSFIRGDALLPKCEFGDKQGVKTFVLYGDSHAQVLINVLDEFFKKHAIKGVYVNNHTCLIPDILNGRRTTTQADCDATTAKLLGWLGEVKPDYLTVMMRWTYRLYPVPGLVDEFAFDNGEGGVEIDNNFGQMYTVKYGERSAAADGKRKAIEGLLTKFSAVAPKLVLIHPVPEVGWDVPRQNAKAYQAGNSFPEVISTSLKTYKHRHRFVESLLDEFAIGNLVRIRPEEVFCTRFIKDRCVAQFGGVPFYFDDDHLSNAGAQLMVDEIQRALWPTLSNEWRAPSSRVAQVNRLNAVDNHPEIRSSGD